MKESNKSEIEKGFGVSEGENKLISNNIFPIDTYSASALDEFNHIKGNMFIVK